MVCTRTTKMSNILRIISLMNAVRLPSYIIDLEDAVETSKPKSFIPELDFYDWEIAGPQPGTWSCGLDPMVPHHRQMIKDPDDSVLEKWAAESAGKELLFLDYNFLRKIIASSTES